MVYDPGAVLPVFLDGISGIEQAVMLVVVQTDASEAL